VLVRYGANKKKRNKHPTARKMYMNNSHVDFGAAFQFAMLSNNLKFAAKKFNFS
jgi:hypothetical protein